MPPYDYESDGYQEDWDELPPPSCGSNFYDHYAAVSVDADCWACPECVICGAVLRWPNEVAENRGRSFQDVIIRRHSDAYLLSAIGDEQRSPTYRAQVRHELEIRSLDARATAPDA